MPHIHELYDYTVTAFIVFEGKVLLVEHPRYGKWIPVGGHIELDEDPEQALYKEIREETGLEVTVLNKKLDFVSKGTKFLPTPNYVDVHEANAPHKHIAFIYFVRAHSGEFVISDEHTNMRWLGEADLELPDYALDASVIFYAQEAIRLATA